MDVATSTVHITAANVGDSRIVLGRRNRRNNKQKPFQPQAASTTKTETSAAAAELPVDDSNNKDKENNSNTATVDGYRRFSSSSSAIRLSADHRVHDPLEVARIEQAGGFLFKGRVCGVLAVTRSLGDFIFKRYVIAHPHVSRTEISTTQLPCCPNNTDMDENDNGDQFVIVACDGLWDVMTDEEAVAIVFEYCAVSRDPDEMKHKRKTAADHLVTLSLQRGTSDNVTVVVVWL